MQYFFQNCLSFYYKAYFVVENFELDLGQVLISLMDGPFGFNIPESDSVVEICLRRPSSTKQETSFREIQCDILYIVPIKYMPITSAVGLFCIDKFEDNQTRKCSTFFRMSKVTLEQLQVKI